jgi:hypothetical protein
MWAHEEGGQSEDKAIERAQIRSALSGTINDYELMLEQQGFRHDGAGATRAEEVREGDEQVDRQEKQIAHESNVITSAKSAQDCTIRATRAKIYEFALHRGQVNNASANSIGHGPGQLRGPYRYFVADYGESVA